MPSCPQCGKECAHNGALSRHMKTHEPKETFGHVVEPEQPRSDEAVKADEASEPVVILEMRGWKVVKAGAYHVIDNIGRRLCSYPTESEAIRFLENSNRWIR